MHWINRYPNGHIHTIDIDTFVWMYRFRWKTLTCQASFLSEKMQTWLLYQTKWLHRTNHRADVEMAGLYKRKRSEINIVTHKYYIYFEKVQQFGKPMSKLGFLEKGEKRSEKCWEIESKPFLKETRAWNVEQVEAIDGVLWFPKREREWGCGGRVTSEVMQ